MLVGLCRWIHPASGHRCVLFLVVFMNFALHILILWLLGYNFHKFCPPHSDFVVARAYLIVFMKFSLHVLILCCQGIFNCFHEVCPPHSDFVVARVYYV